MRGEGQGVGILVRSRSGQSGGLRDGTQAPGRATGGGGGPVVTESGPGDTVEGWTRGL